MLFVGKDVEGERMEIMELKGMCLGFTQVMENLERIFQAGKIMKCNCWSWYIMENFKLCLVDWLLQCQSKDKVR